MSPGRVEGTLFRLGMYLYVHIKSLTVPKIDYRRRRVYSWSQYRMRVSTPCLHASMTNRVTIACIRINDDGSAPSSMLIPPSIQLSKVCQAN